MNRKADTHLSDISSYFLYYVKTDVLINVAIWSLWYLGQICFIYDNIYNYDLNNDDSMGLVLCGLAALSIDLLSLYTILKPVFKFTKFMNFIKQQWPTEEERERLSKSFADAASTFKEKMKISKEYTFMAMDLRIVETKQILSFQPEVRKITVRGKEGSYDVFEIYVIAIVQDYESGTLKKIDILKVGKNKKRVVEETNALISEAARVLRNKIQE